MSSVSEAAGFDWGNYKVTGADLNGNGIVDLTLTRKGEGWTVGDATVETRPIYKRADGKVVELTTRDVAVAAAIAPAHQATLAWVEQPESGED